eukprot:gene10041-265_t
MGECFSPPSDLGDISELDDPQHASGDSQAAGCDVSTHAFLRRRLSTRPPAGSTFDLVLPAAPVSPPPTPPATMTRRRSGAGGTPKGPAREEIHVFGIDLSLYGPKLQPAMPAPLLTPTWPVLQFIICVCGLLTFHLAYAFLQESIFTTHEFQFGFFLTLVQFSVYAAISFVHRGLAYALLAASLVMAMGCANQALVYINYPTQPVVLAPLGLMPSTAHIGFLCKGKSYTGRDCAAAACLVFGLLTLSQANASSDLVFGTSGIALLCAALAFDGVSGNIQELMLKERATPVLELLFFSHLIGSMFLLVVCAGFGQLLPAVSFLVEHPGVLLRILMFSLCGYGGVQFFMALMKILGALSAVITTSFRKVLTLMISYLLFPKPFGLLHAAAITLVFCGVGLDVYGKHDAHRSPEASRGPTVNPSNTLLGKIMGLNGKPNAADYAVVYG